jgi:hypothetical protein
MKTIALIDTRSEVPDETLGILVSTHPDVMAAFVANDAFQKAESGGRHIRTKIVTLKDPLDSGRPSVQPTWPKANEPIKNSNWTGWPTVSRGAGLPLKNDQQNEPASICRPCNRRQSGPRRARAEIRREEGQDAGPHRCMKGKVFRY